MAETDTGSNGKSTEISPAVIEQLAAMVLDADTMQPIQGVGRMDGWANFLTGLGFLSRDKKQAGHFREDREISRDELDAMYRSNDIAARGVNILPDDALREGFEIKIDSETEDGEELDPKELAKVRKGLTKELKRLNAKFHLRRAMRWARLYGGSLAILGIDDGAVDDLNHLADPVDEDQVRAIRWIQVVHRHQVSVGPDDLDPASENFGRPLFYVISHLGSRQGTDPAPLGGLLVHWTRVLRFDGSDLPDDISQGLTQTSSAEGWGDSILQRAYWAIRDFDSAYGSTNSIIQSFEQVIYAIKDLRGILAAKGENLLMQRFQTMELVRSVLNALIIDADKESIERKGAPVAGLADLLDRLATRLSVAFDGMPLTVLMGVSPGGFGTGEHETQNWGEVTGTYQEDQLLPQLERLLDLIFISDEGPTNGTAPESFEIEFKPLRKPSQVEKAEIRNKHADTLAKLVMAMIITPDEAAASAFGGTEFSLDITLDQEQRDAFAELEEAEEAQRAALEATRETPPLPLDEPVVPVEGELPP